MSFTRYAQIERKVRRYKYLVDKFFDGVSLEERTRISGTLLDCCWGELSSTFFEEYQYCMISYGREIRCPYISKKRNVNGFKECNFFSREFDENNCVMPYNKKTNH